MPESIYLQNIKLPSELTEINFIRDVKETCYNTFYPFKIFPEKDFKFGEDEAGKEAVNFKV